MQKQKVTKLGSQKLHFPKMTEKGDLKMAVKMNTEYTIME